MKRPSKGEIKKDEFVKEINKLRKTKTWYQFVGIVNGTSVQIKGYNTWLQVYKVDGIDYSNCMNRKVKEFSSDLVKPLL